MKPSLFTILLAVACLLIAGCEQSQFAISYSRPPGADKGQITVSTSVGGGNLPTGTVSVQLRGYDRDGKLIYYPPANTPAEKVVLKNVPPEVTSVEVQAVDEEDHVLGSERVDLPQASPTP